MALGIRNKTEASRQVGLAIARLRQTQIALYREVVWEVFLKITKETPQFSGAAVAHWVIGVDKPETFFDPSLGRQDLRYMRTASGERKPLERGSTYWMRVAREREKPKLNRIRRNSVVYITNGVMGDTDNGKSSENYIADLQESSYWATKLRDIHQPYINAEESALIVATKYWGKKIDPFAWTSDMEILK